MNSRNETYATCPNCGSMDIGGMQLNFEKGIIIQCICANCRKKYIVKYRSVQK